MNHVHLLIYRNRPLRVRTLPNEILTKIRLLMEKSIPLEEFRNNEDNYSSAPFERLGNSINWEAGGDGSNLNSEMVVISYTQFGKGEIRHINANGLSPFCRSTLQQQ